MAEQSHTPGPWFIREGMDGGLMIDSDSGPVVDARWEGGSSTTLDLEGADAHLIAAAPELLEALKKCRSVIDELMGDTDPLYETSALVACREASDAIAKATGGSV